MDDLDTLRVYPNPYCAIDHKGRPAGACSCDPAQHVQAGDRRWVGARLSADTKLTFQPEGADRRSPVTDVVFEFDTDKPTTIPNTKHYVDRLRAGSLFAADAETAKEAGMSFTDPKAAIENARKGAIAEWQRHYGPSALPAFAKSQSAPKAQEEKSK